MGKTAQKQQTLTDNPHDKDPNRKKQQFAKGCSEGIPKPKPLDDAEAEAHNRYLTETKKPKKKLPSSAVEEAIDLWLEKKREKENKKG